MENISQELITDSYEKIKKVKTELAKKIVWQENLIDSLLIWLFAKGHILVEWVPGLAKTLTVDSLSKTLDLGFNRVQFTPDLLPSDLIGSEIYNTKTNNFEIKKWPIFNNFILADEINRAPSKVQSALLEAMAEKHITIWNDTFFLDSPFIVMATQNPIEHAGTYKLPEAQLDRFMLKVNVSYPNISEEKTMYKKILTMDSQNIEKVMTKKEIFEVQDLVSKIFISDSIIEYVTNIVDATRNPENYDISNSGTSTICGSCCRGAGRSKSYRWTPGVTMPSCGIRCRSTSSSWGSCRSTLSRSTRWSIAGWSVSRWIFCSRLPRCVSSTSFAASATFHCRSRDA